MSKIKILIADDHSLMRVGLNALFSHQKDMTVVGEAHDGIEAIQLASQLKPDVIIMDLMMPNIDGAEATRQIVDAAPATKIIILTSFSTSDDLVRAIQNGAHGAMIKSAPIEEIVNAVRSVQSGRTAFPPEIRQLVRETPNPTVFTKRQLEILHSATRGLTAEDIAKQYNISVSCVLKHFTIIFNKLGAANKTEAVAIALRKHLLKI